MPNRWVSLRHDQLIVVSKAVNEKEQLEKGLKEKEEKKILPYQIYFIAIETQTFQVAATYV
jgi:hypothetical protein